MASRRLLGSLAKFIGKLAGHDDDDGELPREVLWRAMLKEDRGPVVSADELAGKIRLTLHLGAHKTATSTIQKFVNLQKHLFERNGIGATVGHQAHILLMGVGDRSQPHYRILMRRMKKSLDQGRDRYLVSNERSLGKPLYDGATRFYPKMHERLDAVRDALAELKPTIVFYIRPQAAFLESYYLQRVQEGAKFSFAEWYAGLNPELLSWRTVIDDIRATFPLSPIVVRDFSAEIAQGQTAFLQNFFKIVDPAAGPAFLKAVGSYRGSKNLSLSAPAMAMLIEANKHISDKADQRAIRKFLQRRFSNRTHARPVLLTPEEKQRLDTLFAAENAALVAEYKG